MRALVGKLIYNIFYVFYIYCKVKESGKTCFVWQEGVVMALFLNSNMRMLKYLHTLNLVEIGSNYSRSLIFIFSKLLVLESCYEN